MPPTMLFCRDPLRPARVDAQFATEAAVWRRIGGRVVLLDHDALAHGRATAAVTGLPEDIGPLWYRGWMIHSDQYRELDTVLRGHGARLITTPDRYQRAHELPGWYPMFAGLTAPSVWTQVAAGRPPSRDRLAVLATGLPPGPGMVKDYVKSRKHEPDAFGIRDLSDPDEVTSVVSRFVERQEDDLAGGIVLRSFVPLTGNADPTNRGRPAETRIWWVDGEPALCTPHPDTPHTRPMPDPADLAAPVAALDCPFVTTDLAHDERTGDWLLIEVGDGQVSGLPADVDPGPLFRALFAERRDRR